MCIAERESVAWGRLVALVALDRDDLPHPDETPDRVPGKLRVACFSEVRRDVLENVARLVRDLRGQHNAFDLVGCVLTAFVQVAADPL
ncbi:MULTISPECIES: hypothetical protein [Burkholderia]|uniref:hypothetical protein n=1 Tax=Burkholderia TaxID=32008 RepID=UPI001640BDDB|nr:MULTISPECIES: hypothetical protein [Burkholderia]